MKISTIRMTRSGRGLSREKSRFQAGYIPRNFKERKWRPRQTDFANACFCGNGVIYRASNFILTGIKENEAIWEGLHDPDPERRTQWERIPCVGIYLAY